MNVLRYDTLYTMAIEQFGLVPALIEIMMAIDEKDISIVGNDDFIYIYAKDGTNNNPLYNKEMIEFHLNTNCIDYEET